MVSSSGCGESTRAAPRTQVLCGIPGQGHLGPSPECADRRARHTPDRLPLRRALLTPDSARSLRSLEGSGQ